MLLLPDGCLLVVLRMPLGVAPTLTPEELLEASEEVGEAAEAAAAEDGAIFGTDPAAVSLATTRVRARFSDLSRSFSAFSFGICYRTTANKD